ncbi:hypothetical protein SCARD494_04222 [Seiridium cardinale]
MRTPSAATSQTPPSNLSHVRSTKTAMSPSTTPSSIAPSTNLEPYTSSIGGSLHVYGRDDPRPLIRGMIHKTRHFGQSHWMNVATLFKDMFMDIEPLLREPTCPVIGDLQRSKSLARTIKVRRRPTWPACMAYDLPERHIADALVDGYLRTLESVHRILHVPSFKRDYEALWHPDAKPDPAFVIMVKLVLAIGAAAYDDSFSLRESSIRWVYESHAWITEPCPTKHRLDLQGLQIHLLMLSAREVIGMDGDTIYIAAGDLFRRAVTMGLHIDPTYMPRKSALITEMRRRIWNTILEVCLQSSLASGTPPCFSIQDFNTEPPRNLDDDELDDDPRMMDNLESRPANEFTQVSLSLALRRTLSTRYAIIQLLNGVHMSNGYDQTLQLDKELKAAYRMISRGFQPFKSHGDPVQFGLQMVDFLMQAYLSALHTPFANPTLNQSVFAFSRRVAVETAVKIWYILRPSAINISSFARDRTTSSSTSSDIARLGVCGSGILRVAAVQAALVVALDLKTQIQEDERLESILIRPDLLAILRDALEWSLLRIKNGELNVKSYLMFKMIKAHIESLMQNLEKNEVVQLLVKVATEAIQTTLPVLENMVKDCQGEDLTEPPQVSFTAPPEIGWDMMLAGSELDFTNVETMGWVFNDGGTQVSLCKTPGMPEAISARYRRNKQTLTGSNVWRHASLWDNPKLTEQAIISIVRAQRTTAPTPWCVTSFIAHTMASSLRDEEWQQHFYTIRRLWSIDLLSLDAMMERMKQLGFYASKPDYRAKLQAWGLKQNQPSEAWKYIEHQTKKRKRDKKESDVIISGIKQDPKKWKRETSRWFYTAMELKPTETPNSPPGSLITVCTPTAANLEFYWPPDLPFLRFCKQVEGIQPSLHKLLQDKVRGLNETQSLQNSYQSPVKLLQGIGMSAVSKVISNESNVNQVATSLGIFMPELYDGEHLLRSQVLTKGHHGASTHAIMRLLIYSISNNMHGNFRAFETINLVRDSGILQMRDEQYFSIAHEVTLKALLEKTFNAAIESLAVDILSWVLSRGVSPDLPMPICGESYHPLAIIARKSTVDLNAALSCAEILLANGSLAQTSCATHRTLIGYAVSHSSPLFVEALLRSISLRAILQSSGDLADIIFEALLHYNEDHRLDITRRLMFLGMESELAAKNMMSRLMAPEGLVSVIDAEDMRLLGYLHDKGAIWDCEDYKRDFPLGLAVQKRNASLSRAHHSCLNFSIRDIPMSPLQHALWNDERILPLLLHNGAFLRGNELLMATQIATVALSTVDALVAAGVDLCLQDVYDETALYKRAPWDDQVLNKAISQGYDSEEFESFLKESRESRNISNIYTRNEWRKQILLPMHKNTVEPLVRGLLAKKLWPQYAARDLVSQVFSAHRYDLVSLVLVKFPAVCDLALINARAIWSFWPKLDDECRNIFRDVWERAALSTPDIATCLSIIGNTANLAASDGNFELIDFLLAHSQNELPLRAAAFFSPFVQLVHHLGDAGNDAMAGHLGQVIEKLLSAGYTVAPFDGIVAIRIGCPLQTIRNLVKIGFNPCLRYANLPTALQWAVASRRYDVIRYLLDAGCDVNAPPMCESTTLRGRNSVYRTALQLAVEKSDIDAINMLVEAGADVNAPPAPYRGATALQLSVIFGSVGISMKLISLGADINADGCKIYGRTALEGAAEHGRLDTVQLLLEKGCNLEGVGRRQYVRALFLAKKEGHHALASHLQSLCGWTVDDE